MAAQLQIMPHYWAFYSKLCSQGHAAQPVSATTVNLTGAIICWDTMKNAVIFEWK